MTGRVEGVGGGIPGASGNTQLYQREFWVGEHDKFREPHFRLVKCSRLIKELAGRDARTLLDVGCGPGTLGRLLPPHVRYHGIDIAVANPDDTLREANILEEPIAFEGQRFDIVVALGVFEYLGDTQEHKFREIAALLNDGGTFMVSYTNFGHRRAQIDPAFSNVQPIDAFVRSLRMHFSLRRVVPASHNWNHGQPVRPVSKWVNRVVRGNVPVLSPLFAVDYLFLCSPLTDRSRAENTPPGASTTTDGGP